MERFIGVLKAFVAGAGIALVLGTVALIWLAVESLGPDDEPPTEASFTLPPGFEVRTAFPLDGRLALHLVDAEGSARVLIIEPATGRLAATLHLDRAKQ